MTIINKLLRKTGDDRPSTDAEAKCSFLMTQYDQWIMGSLLEKECLTAEMKKFQEFLKCCSKWQEHKPYSIHQELQLMKKYLQLAQVADENIKYNFSLTNHSSEGQVVYPGALLPLIQNACQYGYHKVDKRGVQVQVSLSDSSCNLSVSHKANPYLKDARKTDILHYYKSRLLRCYSEEHSLVLNSNTNTFRATLFLKLNA
ncbi:MAG TPA: hypothetical protein H9853_02370 [Candidatus Sphingobacterium stercoripullorum]|uniref:Signal transduction histidine kinase internal region domain-containing protein n=1 Tax=Candidatus Sphingobacterium stercoripullorum TaxID=2838759 RepID=A0A9D2AYI5_9SPHI|nr:hypothetical protein [Candidatus Sphingobacterium stercoripullorum]